MIHSHRLSNNCKLIKQAARLSRKRPPPVPISNQGRDFFPVLVMGINKWGIRKLSRRRNV